MFGERSSPRAEHGMTKSLRPQMMPDGLMQLKKKATAMEVPTIRGDDPNCLQQSRAKARGEQSLLRDASYASRNRQRLFDPASLPFRRPTHVYTQPIFAVTAEDHEEEIDKEDMYGYQWKTYQHKNKDDLREKETLYGSIGIPQTTLATGPFVRREIKK